MQSITIAQVQGERKGVNGAGSGALGSGGKKIKIGKSTFRLSPFRRVARSAKINLNRYWEIFSQLAESTTTSKKTAAAAAFAEEMEQNRINELLEAENYATSQNSLNSQVEEEILSQSSEIAPTPGFVRQRCCLSVSHYAHSLYSSNSSLGSSLLSMDMDWVSERSFQM